MKGVAIITRTKNRPIMLRRAMTSIGEQTLSDFDWIVVNDGGDPGPVEDIIKSAKGIGISAIVKHNASSVGMEAAANIGLRSSNSKYVVIHDDDDTWERDFLLKTVGFLEECQHDSAIRGVVSRSMKVEEVIENDRIVIKESRAYNPHLVAISLIEMANLQNVPPPISFLYEREVLDIIGYYREDLPVLGDWEFNLRFLRRYEIGIIPDYLANYHWRVNLKGGNYSNTVVSEIDKHMTYGARLRNELLRKDMDDNVIGIGFLVNIVAELQRYFNSFMAIELVLRKLSNNRIARYIYRILT